MTDNHFHSTVEWYQQWLAERRPDLTEEQSAELATGFATTQQPPKKPTEAEEDTAIDEAQKDAERMLSRHEDRKNRSWLTREELQEILDSPKGK